MRFDNMVEYYERQGRDWERYAWIKARAVAGDKAAGRQLIHRLKPFVYRRYFDYGAFESLREMKQKISREVKRKGLKGNIKLGPGGIREVEFFGQIFQMIRGGVAPILQERRIQKVLQTLSRESVIPRKVSDELQDAYGFLRITENRLQEASDLQTHTLPSDFVERLRLAASMEFPDWEAFSSRLAGHMERIHFHFSALLESKDSQIQEEKARDELRDIWSGSVDPEYSREVLGAVGFKEPEIVLRLLEHLRNDPATRELSADGRQRLDRLIPLILKDISGSVYPAQTLNRILELIKTIQRRTCYLALLLENPEARVHLMKLADASPWIVTYLTRHPVVLDELLDPRTLYRPPDRDALESELRKRLRLIPDEDLEYQIEELCVFKQINTLRVAAADVTGTLPLMRVSDHLSDIAEAILAEVLQLAWKNLMERYGEPACLLGGDTVEQGFAVIAYGKLGGIELGYDSDLDMVFLHAAADGQTKGVSRTIENAHFFARLGQRMVHILTTHTGAGFLYETDMRLRPSGGSGPLVSHIFGYRDYQMNKAWTWEHQALVRARAVCGNPHLIGIFNRIRHEVLAQPRRETALRKDVREMRDRLRRQLLTSGPGSFDLRQDEGGMVDIEFLVQYLVLLNAHRHPALTEWSDNVRQIQTLEKTGVIDDETAHLLKEAYLTYRSALHRLSLQEKSARVPDTQFKDMQDTVKRIWKRYLGSEKKRV
jgi:glutamate-ammonia-ligase adenylyltransferase